MCTGFYFLWDSGSTLFGSMRMAWMNVMTWHPALTRQFTYDTIAVFRGCSSITNLVITCSDERAGAVRFLCAENCPTAFLKNVAGAALRCSHVCDRALFLVSSPSQWRFLLSYCLLLYRSLPRCRFFYIVRMRQHPSLFFRMGLSKADHLLQQTNGIT